MNLVTICESRSWFGERSIIGSYSRAFRAQGHRVYDMDRTALLCMLNRHRGRFLGEFSLFLKRARIEGVVSCNLNGNIVLQNGGAPIPFFDLLRVPNLVLLADTLDVFFGPDQPMRRQILSVLFKSENIAFFPYRRIDAEEIRKRGRPAQYLPHAFDARIRVGRPRRDVPVQFIGTVREPGGLRHRALLRLLPMGLSLYAASDEPAVRDSALKAVCRGRLIRDAVMYGAYRRSKISVDLNDEPDAIPPRVFQAMGCGALVIAPRKAAMERIFEDRRHVAFFDDPDDMPDLVRYYLAHETERRRIAEAGRRLVLQSHTYHQRARALLDAAGTLLKHG